MIPMLYDKAETNFNHNGLGFLYDCIDCTVTEVLNGEFELYLEYPINGKFAQYMEEQVIIAAEPNKGEKRHRFRVYEVDKRLEQNKYILYASTVTNSLGGILVGTVAVEDNTAQQALAALSTGALKTCSYSFVSDILTTNSASWERRNILNAIMGSGNGSVIDIWGGELKRENDTIYLYENRGVINSTVIRQGKNITGFKQVSSSKGVVTSILPIFTYVPEGSDAAVTIEGDIVDSPLAANYPDPHMIVVDYSYTEGVEDLGSLNAMAAIYFDQNPTADKPSSKLEVDLLQLSDSPEYYKFEGLETIKLADTVGVWVKNFNVDVSVKIVELTYNPLSEKVTRIIAGTKESTIYDNIGNETYTKTDTLEKYLGILKDTIRNSIQISAGAKSSIFRGPDIPPVEVTETGDLWYKPVDDGEIEMYQYTDGAWDLVISSDISKKSLYDNLVAYGIDAALINVINMNVEDLVAGTIALDKGFRISNNGQDVFYVDAATGLVTITMEDDSGGIFLGKPGSNNGIRITNTSIDFLDGAGDPVASITSQTMRINRGIFVDSAQIGEHQMETITGGITVWRWVPPS